MSLAIALAGAAVWVMAVLFVVAACRVAAGSGPIARARPGRLRFLGAGALTSRAVGSPTARETGEMRKTREMLPVELLGGS